MLDALKDMIEQARSKEASIDSAIAAREQAEAAREARIRELRDQINSSFDEFAAKGYTTEEEQKKLKALDEELDERQQRINALMAIKNRTPEQERELARLRQDQKETHLENLDVRSEINANVRERATANDDVQVVQLTHQVGDNIEESRALFQAHSQAAVKIENEPINSIPSLSSSVTPAPEARTDMAAILANAQKKEAENTQSNENAFPRDVNMDDLMSLAHNAPIQSKAPAEEQQTGSPNTPKKTSVSIEF